jgi:hypothetical protein
MAMTRTDFKALSVIIREFNVSKKFDDAEFYSFVSKMCTHFRQSNPTFDKTEFLRKCGWYNG